MIDERMWIAQIEEAHKKFHKPQQVVWKTIKRVNIEPTTLCNASCLMCDHDEYIKRVGHQELTVQEMGTMLTDVAHFVITFFGSLDQINIGVYCEPLVYPGIIEVVAICRTLAKQRRISTNAMLLDEDMSRGLLEAGLTNICLSLDECERVAFEKIRRGLKWEVVLENVKTFKRIRDEGGYHCKIVVSPTMIEENRSRMKHIISFWKDTLNVSVVPSPEIPIGRLDRIQPWFDVVGTPTCVDMFTIKADGDVVPCCIDIYGDSVLGNMFEDTPLSIYHSEALKTLRRRLYTLTDLPYCCVRCVYLPQFQSKVPTFADDIYAIYDKFVRLFNMWRGRPRH